MASDEVWSRVKFIELMEALGWLLSDAMVGAMLNEIAVENPESYPKTDLMMATRLWKLREELCKTN